MPMNEEIKARWGEWLLAHESEQGKGAEAGIIRRTSLIPDSALRAYQIPGSPVEETATLPLPVVRWAGLNSNNPVVTDRTGKERSLAELNDAGVPFREIWSLINEQL